MGITQHGDCQADMAGFAVFGSISLAFSGPQFLMWLSQLPPRRWTYSIFLSPYLQKSPSCLDVIYPGSTLSHVTAPFPAPSNSVNFNLGVGLLC